MSNQSNPGLLLTGEETITAIVNMANKTQFVASDLIIGNPRSSADQSYNTDIEVTFPIAPTAGDPAPDPVTGEMHYNRLDLGRLFAKKNIRLRDGGVPHAQVHDLLSEILSEAPILLEPADIVDSAIPAGDYPKAVILKATPESLRFIGQFSIEIAAPVVESTGFLTEPAQQANVTPSGAAVKTDGTLFAGQNEIATAFLLSTNSEIEVAGAARLFKLNQGIPSAEGVYHINVADNGDWTLPFSFLLKDKRNGDKITDLYDCSVKITAPGGGVLNFALQRLYGKLALVDSANNLTVDDPANYNEDETLYQSIQRVTFYKSKLGSLQLNSAGSPYGIFEVEIKAVRKNGAFSPVFVSYEVQVEGLPRE